MVDWWCFLFLVLMMLHPWQVARKLTIFLLIALLSFGHVRCFQIHQRHKSPRCGSSSSFFWRSNVAPVTFSTTITRSSTQLNYAVLQAIDLFWRTNPFAAAAIICGVKASAADYIAQRRQIKKRDKNSVVVVENNKADLRRNVAFILYGSLYQGMAQEFIYNHLYPSWFGSGTDPMTVLIKVAFDVTLQTTFVTLPIAYFTKAVIFNYSFKEALSRYTDDIANHGLLTKYISLWFPVNCLTFSIVPEYLRVSWIAFISFFWLIILSSIASRPRANSAIEVEAVADVNEEEEEEEDEYCLLTDGITCNIDG